MEEITVKIDGEEYSVQIEESGGKLNILFDGSVYEVETQHDIKEEVIETSNKKTEEKGTITAPLPGTVAEINCKVGQKVKVGDSLIKFIAMKMENDIKSDKGGVVKEIKVKKKDTVNKGDVLVIID